jgi:hypothetical protein
MQAFKVEGLVTVVEAGELQQYSAQGWELVYTYQEVTTEVRALRCEGNGCSHHNGGHGYCGRALPQSDQDTCTKTYFVMRQNPESGLAELSEKLKEQEKRAGALAEHLAAREKELDEAVLSLSGVRKELERTTQNLAKADEALAELATNGRKMEGHLGAVRKELGDAAVRAAIDKYDAEQAQREETLKDIPF